MKRIATRPYSEGKEFAGSVLGTILGLSCIMAMQGGAGRYKKFKKIHPDIALELEKIISLTGLTVGKKATNRSGKEIICIGRNIAMAPKEAITARIDRKIAKITDGITKYQKKIKNPNFIVRKMSKDRDDLVAKRRTVGDAFAPMSSTIKAVDQAYGKVKKAITAKQRTAVREIINDIEPQIDLDVPAFIRRKGKIDLIDFEPKSTFGSGELSPKVFEDVIRIAQSPEGKRLLIERLSAEEKYSKLVAAVIDIPTTKALPPGGGFKLLSEAEVAGRETAKTVSQKLGGKTIKSKRFEGSISKAEQRRLNAIARGLTPENR